jgi:hypothetical protein
MIGRLQKFLPADYILHSPHHLFACFIYHLEHYDDCPSCLYNYGAHVHTVELANEMWGRFPETCGRLPPPRMQAVLSQEEVYQILLEARMHREQLSVASRRIRT